jgi:hypothetical protein
VAQLANSRSQREPSGKPLPRWHIPPEKQSASHVSQSPPAESWFNQAAVAGGRCPPQTRLRQARRSATEVDVLACSLDGHGRLFVPQRIVPHLSGSTGEKYTDIVHALMRSIFSEPKYYLYGVLIVIVAGFLLLLFMMQTGTSSGGGPR